MSGNPPTRAVGRPAGTESRASPPAGPAAIDRTAPGGVARAVATAAAPLVAVAAVVVPVLAAVVALVSFGAFLVVRGISASDPLGDDPAEPSSSIGDPNGSAVSAD